MIDSAELGGSYVIGGDFNCQPDDLYDSLHPIPNGALFSCGKPTTMNPNNPKDYDYFTSDNSVHNKTNLEQPNRTGLISDHIAIAVDY